MQPIQHLYLLLWLSCDLSASAAGVCCCRYALGCYFALLDAFIYFFNYLLAALKLWGCGLVLPILLLYLAVDQQQLMNTCK